MNKTPAVRFKDFSENWRQQKFGDLSSVAMCRRVFKFQTSDIGEIPFFKIGTFGSTPDAFISRELFEEFKAMYPYPEKGDILISASGSIGRTVEFTGKDEYFQDSNIVWLKHDERIANPFLRHFYSVVKWDGIEGTTIKRLYNDIILNTEITLPSVPEQVQIAKLLDNIDNLITSQKRKCEKLVNIKKSMLYKMFPQNGSKTPEIRFESYTGEWKEKKLEKWGSFYYGKSCPKWSVTDDATIPCVRYGELYTKFGEKIDKVFSHTNMPPENLRFSKGNEVLIPRVGEDPRDYNHCTWLSMKGVAIGEMISVFNTDQNPLFAAIMFNATMQEKFAVRVEGGSVTNLYFDKLKDIDTSFPSLEEQEKIARFFETLNNSITLHLRKLEKLKNLKQAMLHKMFV